MLMVADFRFQQMGQGLQDAPGLFFRLPGKFKKASLKTSMRRTDGLFGACLTMA
jgi:hypothetical protein